MGAPDRPRCSEISPTDPHRLRSDRRADGGGQTAPDSCRRLAAHVAPMQTLTSQIALVQGGPTGHKRGPSLVTGRRAPRAQSTQFLVNHSVLWLPNQGSSPPVDRSIHFNRSVVAPLISIATTGWWHSVFCFFMGRSTPACQTMTSPIPTNKEITKKQASE